MLGHSRQCNLATANETIILGPLLQCPEAEMIYCQCTSEWSSLDGASSALANCFWLLKREQSYWSKRAASFTLNNRISSMSEVLFRKSNFAHKLILKTYLFRMYLAFFLQFWLLHLQKQTHKLLQIFEILPPSGPLWGGTPLTENFRYWGFWTLPLNWTVTMTMDSFSFVLFTGQNLTSIHI